MIELRGVGNECDKSWLAAQTRAHFEIDWANLESVAQFKVRTLKSAQFANSISTIGIN